MAQLLRGGCVPVVTYVPLMFSVVPF
eukprot:COSAG01_NODE_60895_length_292_cov_0.797927_1_plen_25_part_10